MTGYTPIYNLPYPQASDLVSAYPGTGQDLAEEVETVLAAKLATATAATTYQSIPNFTLLNAGGTALTGAATITVSGISGKSTLHIIVSGASASASSYISLLLNGDTSFKYDYSGTGIVGTSAFQMTGSNDNHILARLGNSAADTTRCFAIVDGCATAGLKTIQSASYSSGSTTNIGVSAVGNYSGASAITSISVISNVGNFDAGTLYVYGA